MSLTVYSCSASAVYIKRKTTCKKGLSFFDKLCYNKIVKDGEEMKIEFIRDEALSEIHLIVKAKERDDRVERLMENLERLYADTLCAYDEERVHLLKPAQILRIYAQGQKLLCQTAEGIFSLHARLYEMEERLDARQFVRISKGELVNVSHILRLDVSLSGTIGVVLEGNVKTYTSRRYMKNLKAALGL